ncbi:GIY-YIG nuclease family protein [Marinomonas pollencensis]|uniref:GIY-YIG domain-containing protein n=1 Tax=Marinomonas pollencensis TaxID=491954 RepID=A0A3E0DE68_9GAMM|nr:GIY-YIG nuclease family protein [Marinomonas pollencensis]REG80996.1 hypothetical protein DFP81_1173 [Marinomonas pollencensis]
MSLNYYVYALKDPRSKPAKIFYIGKGTGSRKSDHVTKVDETRKGIFIQSILDSGHIPIISVLVNNISEEQALKIELELISSIGTIDNDGSLYNLVIPKSIKRKFDDNVIVPLGSLEKAQLGLQLLKDSILAIAEENPDGVTNSDCAHYLGLQSDNEGKQQDYLTYSILGLLIKEGALVSSKVGNRRKYKKV